MRARSAEDQDGQNDITFLRQIEHSGKEGLAEGAYDNWAGHGIDSENREKKETSVASDGKDTVSLADGHICVSNLVLDYATNMREMRRPCPDPTIKKCCLIRTHAPILIAQTVEFRGD